jgi:hypothetical protein
MVGEAGVSLFGAYRLARFDAGGMAYFNATVAGVWRSFAAALLVAPLYVALLVVWYPLLDPLPNPLRFALIETESYVISWFLYPVVMIWVSERFGCGERILAYLVAYNWSMVLANGVLIPINIIRASEIVAPDMAGFLWLFTISLVLAYLWFIARTALQVSPGKAAAIVGIDVALNLANTLIAKEFYMQAAAV